MKQLRKVAVFSGYDSPGLEFDKMNIGHKTVAIAEIKPAALIAYGALRFNDIKFKFPEESIMREELIERNVGYDFKKKKSVIPRMKIEKLKMLYKSHVLSRNMGDVSLIKGEEVPEHEFLTYSFPCQDISNSGQNLGFQEGSNTNSSQLWEVKKIVSSKKPIYMMMENVPAIISKTNKKYPKGHELYKQEIPDSNNYFHLMRWLKFLEGLGYNTYTKIIEGKYCGSAQDRKRFFAFSILKEYDKGQFEFEKNYDNGVRQKDILEENVDESYYVKEKTIKQIIYQKNDKTKGWVNQVSQGSKFIHMSNDFSYTVCAGDHGYSMGYVMVKDGTKAGYKQIEPFDYITYDFPNSPSNRGRVKKEYSNTILASANCGIMDENYRFRRFTEREVGRLFNLTENEIDCILSCGLSSSEVYDILGNSIITTCVRFVKNIYNIPDIQYKQLSLF